MTRVKSVVPALYWARTTFDRLFGVVHAGGLVLRPPLGAEEGHQSVLDFLVGVQNGLLVGGHQSWNRASWSRTLLRIRP